MSVMKKRFLTAGGLCAFAVALIMLVFACTQKGNNTTGTEDYNATTRQLISLVENDSRIRSLLTEAIKKGREINPDTSTNPVQSLEDYYAFIDRSQKSMPWDVIFCPGQPTIFGRMYQALCYCYFINCMPLEEGQAGKTPRRKAGRCPIQCMCWRSRSRFPSIREI